MRGRRRGRRGRRWRRMSEGINGSRGRGCRVVVKVKVMESICRGGRRRGDGRRVIMMIHTAQESALTRRKSNSHTITCDKQNHLFHQTRRAYHGVTPTLLMHTTHDGVLKQNVHRWQEEPQLEHLYRERQTTTTPTIVLQNMLLHLEAAALNHHLSTQHTHPRPI